MMGVTPVQSGYPRYPGAYYRPPAPAWNAYGSPPASRQAPVYPPYYRPWLPPPELPRLSPVERPRSTYRWVSDLKDMFQRNEAMIYALHLRTFGAEDRNQDGSISLDLGESGTFLSAIPRLDELKNLGINTIHLLPIHPVSKTMRLGEAGSPYAPADLHELNPEYDTPGNGMTVMEEARRFVREAHKRGIHVMIDVPTFPSYDLATKYPELIARNIHGEPLKPNNWLDVLMFENNGALVDYYEGFFDLMVHELGVDGFRVDVARVRPAWFWEYFINKYPQKAWLAESYSHQDASPMRNIPRDVPEHLLKIGFDAVYGQFHRFPEMRNADEYMNYLIERHGMLRRAGLGKSFIGSFLTPYDYSLMERGGVSMNFLVAGLMATQPWTNPYILDGFTTGYEKPFDMFNYRPRPQGTHPEVGRFLKKMLDVRREYHDVVTQGLFIPVPVVNADERQIIAFARHHQGKTLLVVANKDLNARHNAALTVPGIRADQQLRDLVPGYGRQSLFVVDNNQVKVDLGPGRIHIFEIDTPALPLNLNSYR